MLAKRNQSVKIWEILSLSILQKMKKLILKRTLMDVAKQPFDTKTNRGVDHRHWAAPAETLLIGTVLRGQRWDEMKRLLDLGCMYRCKET